MTRRLFTLAIGVAVGVGWIVDASVHGLPQGQQGKIMPGSMSHEKPVLMAGSTTKCKKKPISLIGAYEGDKVFWRLVHDCDGDRDVWIDFLGDSPCEGTVEDQKPHMTPGDRAYLRCKIKAGAAQGGTAVKPHKYHYKVKGISNEDDPELDVPPPIRHGHGHEHDDH